MKKNTPLEEKITHIITPVVEDMGFTLVSVKATGASGGMTLQIMAENPKTRRLGIEDCAQISKAVSAVLDVENPIEAAYRLEVSSPGIDRPLITRKDFEDYEGFEARLETDRPVTESGQKRFRGILKGLKGENICLDTEQGRAEIPLDSLIKAKLVLTDELIKATAET
jgi:ribosome maturation factor RimP